MPILFYLPIVTTNFIHEYNFQLSAVINYPFSTSIYNNANTYNTLYAYLQQKKRPTTMGRSFCRFNFIQAALTTVQTALSE